MFGVRLGSEGERRTSNAERLMSNRSRCLLRLRLHLVPDQRDDGRLFGLQLADARQLPFRLRLQRLGERAVEVAVEDGRVDVALAADRPRVAELFGDRFDRADDVPLRLCLGTERFELRQRLARQDRAGKGAEVLCGEILAGGLAEVGVDVVALHVATGAVGVDVFEEFLLGQFLAGLDDLRQMSVIERDLVRHAALADEAERERAAADLHVAVADRRQAEVLMLLRVLIVADADQGLLQQRNDGRENFPSRQAGQREMSADRRPEFRQDRRESDDSVVLGALPLGAEARVVPALLPPARVAARHLKVPVGVRADPDVRPGRRDRVGADAGERRGISHDPAIRVAIGERFAA